GGVTLAAAKNSGPDALAVGNLAVTVNAGGVGGVATKLLLTGAGTIGTGECSLFSIHSQDVNNIDTAIAVGQPTSVLLSDNGGGAFFADFTSCNNGTGVITQVTIAASLSSQDAYYRKNAAGGVSLYANDGPDGMALANASPLAVSVGSVAPTKLVLQGASVIGVASCNQFTVRALDSSDVERAVSASNTVLINDEAAGGKFYSNSGDCAADNTNTVSSQQLLNATSNFSFYYRKNSAGNVNLRANDGGDGVGLANAAAFPVAVGGAGGDASSSESISAGKDLASVDWAYVTDETPAATWQSSMGFSTASWLVDDAPLGEDNYGHYQCGYSDCRRSQVNFNQFYARHFLNVADKSGKSYVLRLAFGGNVEVWVNGSQVKNLEGTAEWFDYWNREFDITNQVVNGQNLIAVHVDNTQYPYMGYFDMSVDAQVAGQGNAGVGGATQLDNMADGWRSMFNGTSSGDDEAFAVAVDSQGNVYTGGSYYAGGG
ncbi:MAG: hypothetical protein AABZ44_10415, partial [Elusimicrobiota bacterium]